ncbi:hypothetical protein [Burkholderia cenocepacia]|uniref:hypothetical protein n=1 Tax=Burkholderia cenocepacia TaxID=95486 RepID=UPI0020A4D175|nr:hypothetical protein [Burkholderia cenocepacia]
MNIASDTAIVPMTSRPPDSGPEDEERTWRSCVMDEGPYGARRTPRMHVTCNAGTKREMNGRTHAARQPDKRRGRVRCAVRSVNRNGGAGAGFAGRLSPLRRARRA